MSKNVKTVKSFLEGNSEIDSDIIQSILFDEGYQKEYFDEFKRDSLDIESLRKDLVSVINEHCSDIDLKSQGNQDLRSCLGELVSTLKLKSK